MESDNGSNRPNRRRRRRRQGRTLQVTASNAGSVATRPLTAIQTAQTISPPECNTSTPAPVPQQIAQQPEVGQELDLATQPATSATLPTVSTIRPIEPTTTATPVVGATSSVSAVRVLFRNQQLQCQQVIHTSQSNGARTRPAASIVSANRRLIERQIEAIQVADSRRWNFDFRNCRPLSQSGHRYVHCNDSSRLNCRPLNDQNQGAPNRFASRQQWRSPTRGGQCQHRTDSTQEGGKG